MNTNTLARGKAVHVIIDERGGSASGYVAVTTACGQSGQSLAHKAGRAEVTCKRCAAKVAPRQEASKAAPGKRTLSATLPDGQTITRITARHYLHVVAVRKGDQWGHREWTSRRELADKYVAQARALGVFDEFRVIPVHE